MVEAHALIVKSCNKSRWEGTQAVLLVQRGESLRSLRSLRPMTTPLNHGDNVVLRRKFWADTANTYLAAGVPDPVYFQKLLARAAYWQDQYDQYTAHLQATNTSFHLA